MRYIFVTLIVLFILFFASNCVKEPESFECGGAWQKNFLSSVQIDTSDGFSLILPKTTIKGNNAVIFLDSIEGDFEVTLDLKNLLVGDREGAYFRMVVSNDSAEKTRQVIAGLYTTSDSINGLQLATIINSSGNTPNGDFSDYTPVIGCYSYNLQITRKGNEVYCQAFSRKRDNTSVESLRFNRATFNVDMCTLSLELGSVSDVAIQDSVGVTLSEFSMWGSSINSDNSKYNYFRCSSF